MITVLHRTCIVQVSKLPNGVPVASLENYSPVCRIAVAFNAGPRYEPIDKLGLTHCLRVACNLVGFNCLPLRFQYYCWVDILFL